MIVKKDLYDLLRQAKELFEPKIEGAEIQGLLYPTGSPFAYRYPALAFYARVQMTEDTINYELIAVIHSIDDSGVTIYGPSESREKAKKRFDAFVEFINEQEFACPTPEQIKIFSQKNGVFADHW